MADLGLEEPGLNRLIRADMISSAYKPYFTAGVKEVRAWTIDKGMTAPLGRRRHPYGFAKGFIRLRSISYQDFVTYNGEQGAKKQVNSV